MSRKTKAPFSCNCGRRWDGLAQAHCATEGCHRHFGSVAAFDLHRRGPDDARYCADPATLVRGTKSAHPGRPLLRAAESPHGITWVLDDPRPHPMARTATPGPASGHQVPVLARAMRDVDEMFRRAFGHGP